MIRGVMEDSVWRVRCCLESKVLPSSMEKEEVNDSGANDRGDGSGEITINLVLLNEMIIEVRCWVLMRIVVVVSGMVKEGVEKYSLVY